ncbi:hypothetical protein BpHYR1_045579 [Brachionus plicatilis]|uniref:Uncharacterized protein n=1 Tax=Brachionus plicatilis TaxID=10195 RepID=A0A3M7QLV0_BRAPC|nr:hypothetical protein BpHYR1_045579 [Brachionus plicatilis]
MCRLISQGYYARKYGESKSISNQKIIKILIVHKKLTVLLRKTVIFREILFKSVKKVSPAFFHDSLKFEFFGTSFNKSSLIKKIKN